MAAGEEAVDRARLSGNAQQLVAAHSALSTARLATGDVGAALREAEDAAAIDAPPDFHRAAQPGWCLGAALTAAGNPERGAATLLEAFGGAAMPLVIPAERPAAAADLVEAQLAAGDLAGGAARRSSTARRPPEAGTPWAATTIARARAAVLLAEGRPDEARGARPDGRRDRRPRGRGRRAARRRPSRGSPRAGRSRRPASRPRRSRR